MNRSCASSRPEQHYSPAPDLAVSPSDWFLYTPLGVLSLPALCLRDVAEDSAPTRDKQPLIVRSLVGRGRVDTKEAGNFIDRSAALARHQRGEHRQRAADRAYQRRIGGKLRRGFWRVDAVV